ncbi:RICIN domain-containing protein [Streptomyces sp. NPDC052727]|uniref:RICIN domain-containing protein n=1 Tax=unclassified Streptomyces TaxID=2593676 RepID=UPI003443612C
MARSCGVDSASTVRRRGGTTAGATLRATGRADRKPASDRPASSPPAASPPQPRWITPRGPTRPDAYGAGTGNGTPLVLWTCDGGADQEWSRT